MDGISTKDVIMEYERGQNAITSVIAFLRGVVSLSKPMSDDIEADIMTIEQTIVILECMSKSVAERKTELANLMKAENFLRIGRTETDNPLSSSWRPNRT